MLKKKWLIASTLSALTLNVGASNVSTAKIFGTPHQVIKDGRLIACGVELKFLEDNVPTDFIQLRLYFGISRKANAFVLVKNGDTENPSSMKSKGAVTDGWIRISGKNAIPISNPRPLPPLMAFDIPWAEALASLTLAIGENTKIQVGLTVGSTDEKIYSGFIQMKESEKDEFTSCTKEAISIIYKEAKENLR